MKRVIIVHGWGAKPESGWNPWLKAELEKRGYEVTVPAMPDTDSPVIEKWVSALAETVGTPDVDTYFVGKSVGCQAILRYLETIGTPVGGALFVAGWFNLENMESEEEEEIAEPWIKTPIKTKRVKRVLPKSTLLISDNDPYGAYEENVRKFRELGTNVVTIPNAEHFDMPGEPAVLEQFLRITSWSR